MEHLTDARVFRSSAIQRGQSVTWYESSNGPGAWSPAAYSTCASCTPAGSVKTRPSGARRARTI